MKLLKFLLLICPYLAAAALEVTNPCQSKSFCQRVVLIINGAGKDKVVPGELNLDRFGHSALDDARLLSQGSANQNAPLTYVFSGNADLDKAVKDLKLPGVKTLQSTQSDWDAFSRGLPNDLAPLLEDPRCKAMVAKHIKPTMSLEEKIEVLSNFISVEVSLYGHSVKLDSPTQKYGMAFKIGGAEFASNSDFNARSAELTQGSPMSFDASDFAQVRNTLKHATFRGGHADL